MCSAEKSTRVTSDEDIVISGCSGRFPASKNMREFQENLFNKKDLITSDDRGWKIDHPEIPQRTGKVHDLSKFDASFFGVNFKQAHTMDPMPRMLLEHTFEAIIDAGYNPRQLRGTNTGVFIGTCFSETEMTWFYEDVPVDGLGITGCARSCFANRISYWLGIHGPSYAVDTACSSSLFALEQAYRCMRDGICDAAIVGGVNLILHPYVSLHFSRLGVLSLDGRCKSLDADADGYARSEAIAVLFLQRAKDAKRVYCEMIHAKTNCDGFKEQGITFPSSTMQGVLLQEFYEECKIPPWSLNYLEAHATGTRVGDPEEIFAVEKVLLPGRTTPLKVGAVKSNMGHSEAASGVCSVSKVIIAMETGVIPPNLHYKSPREGVQSLADGRCQVITERTPWEGGLAGVNSFGFGGANAHVLLKSNPKEKVNGGAPKDDLPRLVAVSARVEEGIRSIFDDIETNPVDAEYIGLYHEAFAENIPGHNYRGYTIVGGKNRTEQIINHMQEYSGAKREVWFLYSGLGSQYIGMGEALLNIPVFARAIEKCHNVLKPKRIDIYHILTTKDPSIFNNKLNCILGITAVQIGLTDILFKLGIIPDKMIGYSTGELGCAYADNTLTVEQIILTAYVEGVTFTEEKSIHCANASIDLGAKELEKILLSDIDITNHDSTEKCRICGPYASVMAFIKTLQEKDISVREVIPTRQPCHSRYITDVKAKLVQKLQEIIPNAKPRSAKWISSSVPQSEWSLPDSLSSSAIYHANGLLKPVLFDQAVSFIPSNAVVIEIAPTCFLQDLLTQSLNQTVINIPLTNFKSNNTIEYLLKAIGQLYVAGLQPQLAKLYPPIEFPVSRGTRMISPLIKWDHRDDWYVASYKMQKKFTSGRRQVEITLTDEEFEYMAGHVVDGRNLLPATGYLTLVWETLAMMQGEMYNEFSVVFEDVRFLRATNLPKEGVLELIIMIQKGSGRFEINEGGAAVVTGKVRPLVNLAVDKVNSKYLPETKNEEEEMSSRDVYKELRLRGYHYTGLFRGIKSASVEGDRGHIDWSNNWVAFMDNMLQMKILSNDTRELYVPTGIQKLVIDTKVHSNVIRGLPEDKKMIPVSVYNDIDAVISGGIEIRGLKANAISRRRPTSEPVLEEFKFVAHRDMAQVSPVEAVRLSLHIALENHLSIKIKTLEYIHSNDDTDNTLSELIQDALGDIPLMQADVNVISENYSGPTLPSSIQLLDTKKLNADTNAIIGYGMNLLTKERRVILKQMITALELGGFLVSRETGPIQYNNAEDNNLMIVMEKKMGSEVIILMRKKEIKKKTTVIKINNHTFDWLSDLKSVLKAETEKKVSGMTKILLVAEGDYEAGLLGLVNCLRREPGGEIVRGVLIQDVRAPEFSLQNPLYAEQLQLDLSLNVLSPKGVWGTYRHLPLPPMQPRLVHHARANTLIRGDLSSMRWLEGPLQPTIKHPDLIRIVYAPINFRDIMLSTGKMAAEAGRSRQMQECMIGFEYCGIDMAGKRVMGLADTRCMSNMIIADRDLTWYIPDSWTLMDAATVPCVYGTCYYALYMHGGMKKGDKVLIHAGSGGVGQAAISLALYEGCEVFTTVGTQEKRMFIRDRFPQIREDHIGNSRDTSFEQLIMKQTNGKGVDIVLNSLAEEKLQASVRCLAQGGRFLEIGKYDLDANSPLGLEAFLKEISFHSIMLTKVLNASKERKKELNIMLQEGLRSGAIKPLTKMIFPKDELEPAFRYMAAGKHIGKVIMQIRDEKEPLDAPIMALPRYYCRKDRSYVILGGLGGFGLELADWLVLRGCENLVITSRTGIRNGYQKLRIKLWRSYGTTVKIVSRKDASVEEDCKYILQTAIDLAPIDGIFNLAVVLKDSLLENQTEETYEESFKCKAWSTKVLDKLSRKMCPNLRHFVVFSSVSCGRGNAGQSNYGMSNSVMERICEERVADGLPGLAIQWGSIGDVGLVAEMQEDHQELVIGGTLQQGILSCLHELDGFLQSNYPVVSSMVVAEKRAGGSGAADIVESVLHIMGLKDLKTMSKHTSLAELGMDSMMAVEIKQMLEREFSVFLTAQDIRSLNFAKLQAMAEKEPTNIEDLNSNDEEILTGMKLLIRTVGKEVTSEVCVKLPTKEEDGRAPVYLIPGIEGLSSVFSNLAPKLKSHAVCLQCNMANFDDPTIERMVDSLVPHVMKNGKGRKDFVICGYSYGSILAIELARRLENQGLSGRLVLVDGSPELIDVINKQQLSSDDGDKFQSNIILGIADILGISTSQLHVTVLKECKTWNEKLEALMTILPENLTTLTNDETREIIVAVHKRLIAARQFDYKSLPPIKSPIILIKPTQPAVKSESEDLGLQQITKEKLEIHYAKGNHVTILDSDKIVAAINGEPLVDDEESTQNEK